MHDRALPPRGTHMSRRDAGPDGAPAHSRHAIATDALRYWERHRITYNAVLVLVVATVFLVHLAAFLDRVSVDLALALFLLAVVANVAYCAAYPVDLFVQRSGLRDAWRRRRWILLLVGTLFAGTLAQFVARGMVGAS